MTDETRYPHSVDSPYLVYAEDAWPGWFRDRERAWKKELGFPPSEDQHALFVAQASNDYGGWFEKTVVPRNQAEQKRWTTFLAGRWKELAASIGSEPSLTPEQHVAWRKAQRPQYDVERRRVTKALRDASRVIGGAIRNRNTVRKATPKVPRSVPRKPGRSD